MRTLVAAAFMATALVPSALAQIRGEIADFKTLLPKSDASLKRKGWLLFRQEPMEEWSERLRRSPPYVVGAYIVWSPVARRGEDFTLHICMNRTLYEADDGFYSVISKVEFTNGSSSVVSTPLNRYPMMGSPEHLCVSFTGRHAEPVGKRALRPTVPPEQTVRPRNVKQVFASVWRKTQYGESTPVNSASHVPVALVSPFAADGSKLSAIIEFIRGRFDGEAWRSARRCKNLETIAPIKPPTDADVSDYAKGFKHGWEMARVELMTDLQCETFADNFGIEEVGISSLVRATSKCQPAPKRGSVPPSQPGQILHPQYGQAYSEETVCLLRDQ